jgi:putative transposase
MIQTDLSSFSYKKGTLVPFCKKCGANHFYRNGKNKKGFTRYQCRDCRCRFVWTSDLPRRNFFSHIMTFAVELYTSPRMAISLRGIAQILKKAFNVSTSYETIRQWVLASTRTILRRENPQPTNWHVDETYIKIKGRGFWLWIVFCADKKQVLAWHISQGRLYEDAKIVLKKALQVARARPEKITTDGLYQYASAIKKVIGWNWREQKKRHVIDSGIGKNAIIERLNREVKRRIKYFSTFQSTQGALAFFGLWFYHHNQKHITPPT